MIKPLPNYVLIEPIEQEDQMTKGGLVLPEKAKEKPMKGKIITIGAYMKTDIEFLPLYHSIKKGDMVIFHRWSGQDVTEGQKEYKLVQFKDLMGVYG